MCGEYTFYGFYLHLISSASVPPPAQIHTPATLLLLLLLAAIKQ